MSKLIAAPINLRGFCGVMTIRRVVRDHGALGHGAEGGVVQDGVPDTTRRVAHDTVDARDERELVGAGVMRAVRLGTDAGVQAGREDLHGDLVVAMSNGLRIFHVPRWGIERRDDGCVHDDLQRDGWKYEPFQIGW
jgi:hypothetical protein